MKEQIMAIVGFIMILINALGYIFNWNITTPALFIIGLVFVIIGTKKFRQNKGV